MVWGDSPLEFIELVRRIKKEQSLLIKEKIEQVTQEDMESLIQCMAEPSELFDENSFFRDQIFPYVALRSLKEGLISANQFGTLMKFWDRMSEVLPSIYKPEFVPLFLANGTRNPKATTLLLECFSSETGLINKSPKQLLNGIYAYALHLPPIERGFYLAENRTDKSLYTDTPSLPIEQYFSNHTITQEIKHMTGIYILDLPKGSEKEIMAGFELFQSYLKVVFKHPVRVNPVIGISNVEDTRTGSLNRYRDVAVSFPGITLPKKADNFPAPSSLDFIFHDDYHCIRASRVTPKETKVYIAIGDRLNKMQLILNQAREEFNRRHDDHKECFPEFAKKIEKIESLSSTEKKKIDLPSNSRTPCLRDIISSTRSNNGKKCIHERVEN